MAGYSGTTLAQKLGIHPGCTLYPIGAPPGYRDLLAPLPPGVRFVAQAGARTAIVHVFETERTRLAATLASLRRKLDPQATVWVPWPKKAAKVPTTITEDVIREVALPLGFVDI